MSTLVIARLQQAIVNEAAFVMAPGMRVLDVGCGNGASVRGWMDLGFDAYGCDFHFKEGPDVDDLVQKGRISTIAQTPYRLPFPDAHFDLIVTNQVFEHVRDYDTTLGEMRRVLKPTGCCLHMFPSRGLPIEPHVFVPFATVLQNKPWLKLWALLGVRKPNQRGLDWRHVADSNCAYLTTNTNYLKAHEIKRHFLNHFPKTRYVEQTFLRHSPNARGRFLHRAGQAFPPLFMLYRQFWSRVILARP
jgi:SAM-dependent methyltransferase